MFIISELDEGKMSVGKIYAGLLIAENWKAYKASQNASNNFKMVSCNLKVVSYNLKNGK